MSVPKCPHGYFTHSPFNKCPWCFGVDASNNDAVPVLGHGNGWLLRKGEPACPSCGGPRSAGWGATTGDPSAKPAPMCYGCAMGGNSKEAIAKRAVHEAQRGVKKIPGSKS